MSAADHDVKPGDSQDEVCKCGHLHAEHYGKVATARCTVCEGPARPVEDREPVGPYAPTRNTDHPIVNMKLDAACPTCKHLVAAHTRDSDGAIVCSVCQMPAAFERGRQQGDADRAQRIQHLLREQFERGRQQGLSERGSTLGAEFDRGKAVGAANREAELLDQGWTPPGATSVDARLLEIVNSDADGPTDYEVWRDALTLSATNVFPIGGTGEASTFDDDRRAQILADAEFFRHHLINYPTISPDEAAQAIDDQIDAITEHEAAADFPAKETPGAEADYPF